MKSANVFARTAMLAACIAFVPQTARAEGGYIDPVQPARGLHGAVATSQHNASQVGLEILRGGGNAVDAAIAIAYALAVVDPCCGNLGGGGFMLVHFADGRERFIDFRERAPLAATRDMYLDASGNVIPNASLRGYRSAGVPGTVAGLERAWEEFGSLPRVKLMAPAIALASGGYVLDDADAKLLASGTAEFAAQPNVAAIFTHHGHPFRSGERLRQTQLAATLTTISYKGKDGFYKGSVARALVAANASQGGLITLDDLAQYRAVERDPLHCTYHGYTLIVAPPPSSGGVTLCEIAGILDPTPLASYGWNSVMSLHATLEAERLAYADRNTYLGDPDFVTNPIAKLLAPNYLAAQRARIGPRATPSSALAPGLGPYHEGTNTTHFSVVDAAGNAVALTYTINDLFGAHVIPGDLGFFMNDEMDDFTSKPGIPNMFGLVQGPANEIAPGKRPLSSMSPTIALRDGKVALVAGSPGGSHIITTTLNVLQNVIDYRMNAQAAVDAPRTHKQWLPESVDVERGALSPETETALTALGYTFTLRGTLGLAEAIAIDPRTGMREAGSDRRRSNGAALAY
jgi:gamma-glutamyltranspeptidase/glutathione hydrolase